MDLTRADKPRLRVVLPAYNEARALTGSVLQLLEFCQGRLQAYDWHLYIADNGSTDKTPVLADGLAATHAEVQVAHRAAAGRGGALLEATADPTLDYLLYTDVDLSADIEIIPQLLAALDGGADLVVGTRLHPQAQVHRRLYREVLSRGYNVLLQTALGVQRFHDAQCGLKAWRRERLAGVLARVRDRHWFFDTEMLVLAERAGLGIVEIPVDWTEDTDSSVRIPRAIYEKIRGVIRLRRGSEP